MKGKALVQRVDGGVQLLELDQVGPPVPEALRQLLLHVDLLGQFPLAHRVQVMWMVLVSLLELVPILYRLLKAVPSRLRLLPAPLLLQDGPVVVGHRVRAHA